MQTLSLLVTIVVTSLTSTPEVRAQGSIQVKNAVLILVVSLGFNQEQFAYVWEILALMNLKLVGSISSPRFPQLKARLVEEGLVTCPGPIALL
jgi:hypothetical protein